MTIKPVNKSNFWFGVSMLVFSLAGMAHTYLGTWTKGAGEAAKFFPRVVYIGLFLMGAVLILQELMQKVPKEPKALPDMKWTYPVFYTAAGILFFLTVYYIGPMVGIFLYLLGMMLMFALEPKKEFVRILIISVCCTIGVYLIFTKLIFLIVPGSLLF